MGASIAVPHIGIGTMLMRSVTSTWSSLPIVLVSGISGVLSVVPLILAAATGPSWVQTLAALPAAIYLSGLARFAAVLARGDRPRLSDLLRTDPVSSLVLVSLLGLASAAIGSGPGWSYAGYAIWALTLLISPYALCYGAVRGVSGIAALRGAAILIAARPSWAISLISTMCLGGFLIAATAGVLVILVPCAMLAFGCNLVTQLLREIEAPAGA